MIISIYQANGSETTGLFLQFPPQIDTTPRGESRHKTHDQIHAVHHNCSFYWHHPGFDNFSMDRLLKKTSQKDCSMKDNIFFVDIFSRQSVRQKADRTCFLEEQLRIQ